MEGEELDLGDFAVDFFSAIVSRVGDDLLGVSFSPLREKYGGDMLSFSASRGGGEWDFDLELRLLLKGRWLVLRPSADDGRSLVLPLAAATSGEMPRPTAE